MYTALKTYSNKVIFFKHAHSKRRPFVGDHGFGNLSATFSPSLCHVIKICMLIATLTTITLLMYVVGPGTLELNEFLGS